MKAACVQKERYFPHSTMWGNTNARNDWMLPPKVDFTAATFGYQVPLLIADPLNSEDFPDRQTSLALGYSLEARAASNS